VARQLRWQEKLRWRKSEGGQKFLPPTPLPFCPPERFSFAREARNHSEFSSKKVRTSSKKHRRVKNCFAISTRLSRLNFKKIYYATP